MLIQMFVAAGLKLLLNWTAPQAHQLKIKATVPDSAREVAISLLNDAYGRSSVFQTDGRRTYWVDWRGVPGGVYDLRGQAALDNRQVIQSAIVRVVVQPWEVPHEEF